MIKNMFTMAARMFRLGLLILTLPNVLCTPTNIFNDFSSAITDGLEEKKRNIGCDDGWEKFGGHCYYFSKDQFTDWDGAKDFCETNDSMLVRIESWDENNWLWKRMNEPENWIGGKRTYYDEFVWYNDMEDMPYTNFDLGEPNNKWDSENCLLITSVHHGGWNDVTCSMYNGFICEKGTN